jgi:hypothetical protein
VDAAETAFKVQLQAARPPLAVRNPRGGSMTRRGAPKGEAAATVFLNTGTPRPRLVDFPLAGDALGGSILAHSTP